ncbi:MAG: hypothetical protein ACK5LV_06875 [Lachnospirales bacterium]
MKKYETNNSSFGLTLVDVIVIVAALTIIAALVVPKALINIDENKVATAKSYAHSAYVAASDYNKELVKNGDEVVQTFTNDMLKDYINEDMVIVKSGTTDDSHEISVSYSPSIDKYQVQYYNTITDTIIIENY